MRVLWFVNIMMPDYVSSMGNAHRGSGGWMQGLLRALGQRTDEFEISVAFLSPEVGDREINRVHYYALGVKSSVGFESTVRACLERVRPDVIHIHGTEDIAQVLPDFVYRSAPVVISIQGIMSACGENYLGGLSHEVFRGRRNLGRALGRRPSPVEVEACWRGHRTMGELSVVRKTRYFMGRTNFDRDWINGAAPGARYFHVDEILRPEFYGPKWNSECCGKHVIFASSAMTYPLKGGHLLLEALSIVAAEFPDVRVRIPASSHVVPRRSLQSYLRRDEYARYLYEMARDKNLLRNIEFLPKLAANEMVSNLLESELFCLSSTMENSPNSLCEAMLLGVPCVAFDVGGIGSLLKKDCAGLLARPNDATSFAQCICRLLDNSELARKFGLAARCVAEARHNPMRVVRQLLGVYFEIAGKSA